MKKVVLLLMIISCFFLFETKAYASEKSEVNLYLFYSDTCPHCEEERKLLNKLKKEYDNLNVYEYEILNSHNKENAELLKQIEKHYNIDIMSVPYTIIGDKKMSGYSSSKAPSTFRYIIDFYTKNGYTDELLDITKVKGTPKVINENASLEEYLKEREQIVINIPFIGDVDIKDFGLPIATILIAMLDGINPCAMWVLLFLISMLIGIKDKKRMWILGLTFILTSAIIYYLFMVSWLNITSYLTSVTLLRNFIALIAVIGGVINLTSYIKHRKEEGCDVIDEKKRSKIFTRIKKFTTEKSFLLALLGIIALAASVNLVELACSAGLPVMYIEILKINNLPSIEYYIYLLLYVFIFLIDDLIIFFIAMFTMQVSGFSTKFGKVSKLVGGILLLLIGIIMFIKPEWLMFNFK